MKTVYRRNYRIYYIDLQLFGLLFNCLPNFLQLRFASPAEPFHKISEGSMIFL